MKQLMKDNGYKYVKLENCSYYEKGKLRLSESTVNGVSNKNLPNFLKVIERTVH
jgi:hypothetical protein